MYPADQHHVVLIDLGQANRTMTPSNWLSTLRLYSVRWPARNFLVAWRSWHRYGPSATAVIAAASVWAAERGPVRAVAARRGAIAPGSQRGAVARSYGCELPGCRDAGAARGQWWLERSGGLVGPGLFPLEPESEQPVTSSEVAQPDVANRAG
jgi:hypothetical protein